MSEGRKQQEVCAHCGGTHLHQEITITFKSTLVEAVEKMAERRKESVEQFIFHLLWLEAGKLKGIRELMSQDRRGQEGSDEQGL